MVVVVFRRPPSQRHVKVCIFYSVVITSSYSGTASDDDDDDGDLNSAVHSRIELYSKWLLPRRNRTHDSLINKLHLFTPGMHNL